MTSDEGIIRSPSTINQRYLLLSRALLQDSRLSFTARGLLVFFLSLPDQFTVDPANDTRSGHITIDEYEAAMLELRKFGYLVTQANGTLFFEEEPERGE